MVVLHEMKDCAALYTCAGRQFDGEWRRFVLCEKLGLLERLLVGTVIAEMLDVVDG